MKKANASARSALFRSQQSAVLVSSISAHGKWFFFFFFFQIISYDSPRGGVSVITEKGEVTTSFLLIQKAKPSDSGRYQCNPSNAQSKSITVHVLNGEYWPLLHEKLFVTVKAFFNTIVLSNYPFMGSHD